MCSLLFKTTFLLIVSCRLIVLGRIHKNAEPVSKEFIRKFLQTSSFDDEANQNDPESTSEFWIKSAQQKLQSQLAKKPNTNIAKNLIIFLGDGMSIPTITAARIHQGQKAGRSGEEGSLSFEEFPHVGLSKTYCHDMQTADSACSATAYLTGIKANYQTIGVNAKVHLNDCQASLEKKNHASSIMQWAQRAGKATGIVTTTRVTHASPAGTYARTANRNWECDADMSATECSDIAKQLIREDPGRGFNVIYGGGRKKFLPTKAKGQRKDGLNLIDEWLMAKDSPNADYVGNRQELLALNHSKIEHVLGLFASSHLDYHLNAGDDQPTLKELTISAINVMKKNPRGFVLFVEGGRIDHGHHSTKARYALDETIEFSDAIHAATLETNEDETLMVVTADHAHTMTISGYSQRGRDILGLNSKVSDVDKMPYMTISYANGPSGGGKRQKVAAIDTSSKDFKYPALVAMETETHGGDDVAIFARGPYSHLFSGVLEQNTIPHFMAYASCIGEGLTACNEPDRYWK